MNQCICREGSNHARLLPRYIEELLSFAREHDLSIEAVALSEGPGSYTGLRIGTSTAKGLCYGLNIPLIPIPTLEVLKEASGVKEGILMPMIDARRMEVYTVINGETKAVVVENEDSLYEGAKCAQVFTRPNWHHIPDIVPEAQFMGVLAEQITNHQSQITNAKSVDLAYYEPYYLKEFIAAQSHVKGLK